LIFLSASEISFTDRGVSGLQLSRPCAPALGLLSREGSFVAERYDGLWAFMVQRVTSTFSVPPAVVSSAPVTLR
jgi:hypothetical protein